MQKFIEKYEAEFIAGTIILAMILIIGSVILYDNYERGLRRSVKEAVVTSKYYYINSHGIPIYKITIIGKDRNGNDQSFDYCVDHDDYKRFHVGMKW